MSLTPYQTSVLRALKWQQNKAPNITSLITQKDAWYQTYQWQFWANFQTSIFDLRTANAFGILIWCIILGVPSQLFGLYGNSRAWAYGPKRQNYKYSGAAPAPPNENIIGGNFAGGGGTTIFNLQEARWLLQLRYATLVSNGRIAYINKMLNWIFMGGQPWNYTNKQYFYVDDVTSVANPKSAFQLEYHVGSGLNLSPQFINLLNTAKYGLIPTTAGSSYNVIADP